MTSNLINLTSFNSSMPSARGNGRLRPMHRARNQLLLVHAPVITHRHSLLVQKRYSIVKEQNASLKSP